MSRMAAQLDHPNSDGDVYFRPHTVEETIEAVDLAAKANDAAGYSWVFIIGTIESTDDICRRIIALENR